MQKYSNCEKDFFKFELVKAPLATFDTIDLGSDDESSVHHSAYHEGCFLSSTGSQSSETSVDSNIHLERFTDKQISNNLESDSGASTPTNEPEENLEVDICKTNKKTGKKVLCSEFKVIERTRPSVDIEPAIVLKLDANISDKFKKKRCSSSSSDSDSDVFTFENIQTRHQKDAQSDVDGKNGQDKSVNPVTLSPILIDPSQIKSPSKRKAYEKRLQRLQVTTSPIARPRSTTPINVVTLDEYISSSPEFSPTTDSHPVEKLKIVLPTDEFTPKPRGLRRSTRKDSETSEFTEELLFSHTRSALVVDQGGHLPISPKRVLIPPTTSPTTSPKISTASKLNLENTGSQKYVYFRCTKQCISPLASEPDENWATFPESAKNTDTQRHLARINQKDTNYAIDHKVQELGEDVLTVNIANNRENGKCDIELTLSSSNSSNSVNPSPDSSSVVTSTNPLGQDRTESELDFPVDTSEDDSGSLRNACRTPDSDQY